MKWPGGKKFAFTIFDDADESTVKAVKPVYELLDDLGLRTTMSVWPITIGTKSEFPGSTCDDPEHLAFARDFRSRGFEIGLHLASFNTAVREETIRGLEAFRSHFGAYPRTMAAHENNVEALYWGSARFTGLNRVAYNLMTGFRNRNRFRGHVSGDPHFWGDVSLQRIDYCRNFVFQDVNTLKMCPEMPYHDPAREYVRRWYAGSNGAVSTKFCETLNRESIDRLVDEGGACIMYSHFAYGFARDGEVDPEVRHALTYLSRLDGWFVPVCELLDYLERERGDHTLTDAERNRLERTWLWERVKRKESV